MEATLTAITSLLGSLNTLTPFALLALMIGVLYVQIWKQPTKDELNVVKDNHLHSLPEIASHTQAMVDGLRRIEEGQSRIEIGQTKAFAEINTKLDRKR